MSKILKSIIGLVNLVVKVEAHILTKKNVAPKSKPGPIYRYPQNYFALPVILREDFLQWVTREVNLPDRYLYTLKNVCISWHGIVFKNLSLFVPSLMSPVLADSFKGRFLFKQWMGKRQVLPRGRPVALVFDQWSAANYYHWIIETLPRLLLLAEERPDAVLLLPDGLPEYVRATTKVFGFHEFIAMQEGVIYSSELLLWPERMGTFWMQDAGLLHKAREAILTAYNLRDVIPHRKVYVSRSRAKIRRLVNENSLYNLLAEAGFEIIYFEGLSFQEQVKLVAETVILVGVHGANLTNILFMPPQGKLVELINEKSMNLAYYKLSAYCGIEYYCLPCQNMDVLATNDSDISIDIHAFEQLLQQICG